MEALLAVLAELAEPGDAAPDPEAAEESAAFEVSVFASLFPAPLPFVAESAVCVEE